MPPFTPRRFEQILPDMIARVVTRTNLIDINDASSLKHVLAASSREDDEIYFQMENVLALFNIDDATGDDLDERAAEIQPATITRIGPRSAVGTVIFSRAASGPTVNIPIGTRVKTTDGIVFLTTGLGTITAASPEQITGHGVGRDSAPVPISAEVPGIAGNVVSGSINKFDTKPPGIEEVTNLVATTLGRDEEKDDAFRQRIKDFIASLARCTIQALETGVLGLEDATTGASILFAKAVEDLINLGNVTVFIDDGTGQAESATVVAATALAATFTWAGPSLIVTTPDTSGVVVGDFIRQDADGQWFEIASIVPSTSVTVLNPGSLTVPTGVGSPPGSSVDTGADRLTQGLAGPPVNSAVGGETELFTDNKPIKAAATVSVVSSLQGVLATPADYTINPASGQIVFTSALTTGEVLFAEYTFFTGLIALAQKVIDGDLSDRENFPGLRAGGVLVVVNTPVVLIQTVEAGLTIAEGFTQSDVITSAKNAVQNYINSLGISDDVIRNEIISRIQALVGVTDLDLIQPSQNVIILDDQLARTTDANLDIT